MVGKKEFAESIGIDVNDISGGENITGAGNINGQGYDSVTIAMGKFMNSEGHRNTLLNAEYTRVGVGFSVGSTGTVYCCQRFGR